MGIPLHYPTTLIPGVAQLALSLADGGEHCCGLIPSPPRLPSEPFVPALSETQLPVVVVLV